MSPQVALCEAGSRESSAGGFRRVGLVRREVVWTALRWARITQAGLGSPAHAGPGRPGPGPGPPWESARARPAPLDPRGPRGASFGVVAIPAGPLASRGPLARETDARWIGAAVRKIAGVPAMVAVRPAAALLEGPWRRRLSKSVAKARILPGCVKRNVDIPRFLSPPIPPRSAFATNPDMPLPRNVSGAPRAPLLSRPWSSAPSCRSASSARRADVRARARIRSRATASPARWSASGRRPILPLPGADYSVRRRIHGL